MHFSRMYRRQIEEARSVSFVGLWDFTLLPPVKVPGEDTQLGSPALEAVREQLGIRLKPDRAVVALPVIDHVQKPEDN